MKAFLAKHKRHIVSAGVTFLAGVATVVVAQIDSVDLMDRGEVLALLFLALRTGIKYLAEWFLASKPAKK